MEYKYTLPTDWNAVEVPTAVLLLSEPSIVLAEGYDTVRSLYVMVKGSNQWQEIIVLKDWLSHSPYNINLLTPDTMVPLFQCIKGDYSFYTFCQTLGAAMNDVNSTNKCTTRHIAEAAKAVSAEMKVQVCNLFAPFCTDRVNARSAFKVIGLTDIEMESVMVYYV